MCTGGAAAQLEAGGGGTGDGELVWEPSHVCCLQGHPHHLVQLPPESLGLEAAYVLTCRHTPAAPPSCSAPTCTAESLLPPQPLPRSALSIQPELDPSRKDLCLKDCWEEEEILTLCHEPVAMHPKMNLPVSRRCSACTTRCHLGITKKSPHLSSGEVETTLLVFSHQNSSHPWAS